ncbi:hypothetical protein Tco_0645066, partial [Tanacetum coccineum]
VANDVLREFVLFVFDRKPLIHDVKKALAKNPSKQVGQAVEIMLKTGRLVTQSTLDLKE